jgi:prolyl-tRNA editing enzyme YbaK/EbsC (Cys-tRNA(Pro) deacylase)
MHPNIDRVTAAASRAGLDIQIRRYPEGARTAADAAAAIGCEVAQIVKSLVFMADEAPILALVSGANMADTDALARELGVSTVRRATGQEARAATGFAIGGVPPFGHDAELAVVIDRDLTTHEVVWAAAGLPDAVFPIAPDDLVAASGGRVADIGAPA